MPHLDLDNLRVVTSINDLKNFSLKIQKTIR